MFSLKKKNSLFTILKVFSFFRVFG